MSVPWYLMAKGKGGGYKTASGPIVSINDALAAPLRALTLFIDPVQDLHGYESPWPAGGGKNKFDVDKMVNTSDITISNGVITVTGNSKNSTKKLSELADLTVGEAYILTANTTGSGNLIYLYGTGANVSWSFGTSKTITQEMLDALVFFYGGSGTTSQISNFMIRLSSVSDASFAPYSNLCPISGWTEANVWVKPTYDPTADPTATIQLGQTVYGGTLDATNGVLTVDRAYAVFDGSSDETWAYYAVAQGNMFRLQNYSAMKTTAGIIPAISDAFKTVLQSDRTNGTISAGVGTKNIDFIFDGANSLAEWREWLAENNVQLCYELATPITIPLTPQEISTLQGANNIWVDSGDVTVEYLSAGGADPDLMKLAVAFMGRNSKLVASW